ncbi:MAG: hypothetical protein ACI4TD_05890, partial [Phocaeicola sp.]
MTFVLVVSLVVIIGLIVANYKLQNDIKFISEMYRSLNSDHNEVIDKWGETLNRWNETLDTCNEINDLNGKLFDKSKEME